MVVSFERQVSIFAIASLCLLTLCLADRIVQVDKQAGIDSCAGSANVTCKTMEEVSENLNGNCSHLTIQIMDEQTDLNSIISFENCTVLTIKGMKSSTASFACMENVSAGFQFRNVSYLALLDMKVISCGFAIQYINFNSMSAMHIHQCEHLLLQHITFTNSTNSALVVSDTSGHVQIRHSSFLNRTEKEHAKSNGMFPGGLHVQFTEHLPPTSYIFTNCIFENNKEKKVIRARPQHSTSPTLNTLYGYGLGGGMGVLFMGTSHNVSVFVDACRFIGNKAHTGAGLYVHFQDSAEQNVVRIVACVFHANSATAGGGLGIAMDKLPHTTGNYVYVHDSTFSNNTAHYGGGTVVFTVHSSIPQHGAELIVFYNNTWEYNYGMYSPALDISTFRSDQYNTGYLPIPVFIDCSFNNNAVHLTHVGGNPNTTYDSSGAVVFTSSTVYFEGTITFTENRYTALKLVSSKLQLREGTKLNFISNEGVKGGAMALYGFSALAGNKDCSLFFFNNSATEIGGGLFHQTIEERDYIEGKSCFLQYTGNSNLSVQERNLTFTFSRNSATNGGSAIYSASLYACFFAYLGNLHTHNLSDFLQSIGTFQFSESLDTSMPLGTDGVIYNYESRESLSVAPGETVAIPISVSNELKKNTNTRLLVTNEGFPSTVIFHNNKTTVYGMPGRTTSLLFKTQNTLRNSYFKVRVRFTDSPPGYNFYPDTLSCNCSAENPRTSYFPIRRCNHTSFRAIATKGFWVGTYKPHTLYTSSSARTYEYPLSDTGLGYTYMLPKDLNDLEPFMCGQYKQGLLCGKCKDNYTAYYHSRDHKCGPNGRCYLSLFFFLVSEVFPIVVLFSLVIRFNIDFTSGWVNGMIFYCQVVDLFSINLDVLGSLQVAATTKMRVFQFLQDGHRLIYGVLNLEFFHVNSLSFCLWAGAGIMDAIAVKYFATLFTFALVLILTRTMKVDCKCCKKSCQIEHSVTKGLSAFLIICYSQCTGTTFQILRQQHLVSGTESKPVTEYGAFDYFSQHHLCYAIPAVLVICTLVSLPVLYLLLLPLLLKLLLVCNLSEHPCVLGILQLMWQNKLMPIMDTFQSCFKDRLRFFAGVYFAYRLVISSVIAFGSSTTEIDAASEYTLLIFLGIHAIAQPYKNSCHNMIDAALFLNLTLINGLKISMDVYMQKNYKTDAFDIMISNAEALFCMQLLLIYTPLILVGVKGILVVKKKLCARTGEGRLDTSTDALFAALEEQRLLNAAA